MHGREKTGTQVCWWLLSISLRCQSMLTAIKRPLYRISTESCKAPSAIANNDQQKLSCIALQAAQ